MKSDSANKLGIARRFFRYLWRALKTITILVYGLIAVFILGAAVFAFASQRGPDIPEGGALLLNPTGALVEQHSAIDVDNLLLNDGPPPEVLVKDITDALAFAKDDDRIKLVVLQLDGLHHGLLPKLERITSAIAEFKTSGKKVIAASDNYSQSALFIAAHADEVLMNPEGVAALYGFGIYQPYFNSFLEKHDVSVNVFKVGKYKSAVDPFLRDDMSKEDRLAWTEVLDPLWNVYTTGVEKARGMSAGSINTVLENAPENVRKAEGNLARLALEAGLVDRLVTDNERREYLIELTKENGEEEKGTDADADADVDGEDEEDSDDDEDEKFRRVAFKEYLRDVRQPVEHKDDRIAVITAVGNIVDGHAPKGVIGAKSLSKLIRKARLNDDVKAIVLRIDSGGGSKTASEMIRTELQAAQDADIPVVASMGSFAASGGYWIAASADEIWALPTTITGSIGIFGLLPTFEKTLANHGVYSDGIATTPLAGGASAMRGVTPVYGEVLQSVIEAGYQQFLTTVADGRDMDVDAVDKVAQGRIWTGEKAQELGLVDELGDLDEAINAAASLADVDDYSTWYVAPELSFEEQMLRRIAENAHTVLPKISNNPVSRLKRLVHTELGFLERLNDPHHAYVICGGCLAIQ